MSLQVLLVGHGFMGANHGRKVDELASIELAGVVDPDPSRARKGIPFYSSFEEGFKALKPDIVAICSSTKTHFEVLSQVFAISKQEKKYPHLLMEKPFVETTEQMSSVCELLAGYPGKISGGYLFRQSPIVAEALSQMQSGGGTIEKVTTIWQKDRMQKGPVRPSAGVHVDESTHPADLVIHYLLPEMEVDTSCVTIVNATFKRQSEAGQIVDQEKQNLLYKDEPEKLDPVAEVTFSLDVGGIPVEGFSSFAQGPQRREISIEMSDQTTLFLEFDVAGVDRLSLIKNGEELLSLSEVRCDKLKLEWEAFLNYCESGTSTRLVQTLNEMEFDIRLTEALGTELTFPHELSIA